MLYWLLYRSQRRRKHLITKRGPAAGTEEAKHGGQAVKAKYGSDYYVRIGK